MANEPESLNNWTPPCEVLVADGPWRSSTIEVENLRLAMQKKFLERKIS
tara:strand:+ start:220 stop:366 length:147 start_codon:yes stop_codon:yes gene_type:complete